MIVISMLLIVSLLFGLLFAAKKEIIYLDEIFIRVSGLLAVSGVLFFMIYKIGKLFLVF
ncbi:hypothetical protein [Radiobacillus sp. PE A8.2]|uniref:hypothetical protein n=1 Tax=Radiobacillus sp. PE A8.2 TaxID=3380349 RepID=UPI00388F2961